MSEQIFNVPAISCGHCVRAIQEELTELDGVTDVQGDADQKTVQITFDAPASPELIKAKLDEIGYPAA